MAAKVNALGAKREDGLRVPLSQLIIKPENNTRFAPPSIDRVMELADDIEVNGQIAPVVVRLDQDKRPEVIAGFTRCLAFERIKEKTGEDPLVKIDIFRGNEQEAVMLSISENMKRVDLSPMDHARNIRTLAQRYAMTPKEISIKFGKSEAWVTQKLKLLDLTKEQQMLVHSGEMAENAAWSLLSAPPERRDEVIQEAKATAVAKPAKSAPAAKKGAPAKKTPAITDTDVRRAIRNTEAVPPEAQPARKLKEVRNYLEETIETEPAGSPIKDYYKGWVKFFDGKISQKQMDNLTQRFLLPPEEPQKGKPKK